MDRLALTVAAALGGAVVAGPLLSHAVLHWIAWRGVVPLLLGWEPRRAALGRARPLCRACHHPLTTPRRRPSDETWTPEARGEPPVPKFRDGGARPSEISTEVARGEPLGSKVPGRGPGAGEPGAGAVRGEVSAPRARGRRGAAARAWLPTLPWLVVGGRCRSCGEPIGRWVLGIELATGLAFGGVAARFGWSAEVLPVLVLTGGLVAMSAVDLVCSRIPTRFVYLTGAGVAGAISVAVLVDGEPSSLVGALVGGAAYLGVLGTMWLVAGGGLGFGDVRLGTLIGVVAGWVGWESDHPVVGPLGAALLGLLVAAVAASLVGVVLLVARRRSRPYPFGPWLALGGLAAILAAA